MFENTDFRESLAAEFEKLQTQTDSDTDIPKDILPDAPQEEDNTEDDRERDEKGRFKAKEKEETIEDAVEEAPAEENTDQGSVPEPKPAEQPLSPPERWSAEWKAKFTALPRDAQQLLLDREGEYDKGFTQKSQEAANLKRQYEPLEPILAPRRQAWAMQGLDDARALTQLLALSDFAANKPQEFIQWFAQQRGINLTPPPAQEGAAAPTTPDFTPILQKVTSLEQQLQTQQQAEIARQINAFKADHEHFEDVRTDMANLLNKGLATDMQDAYEKAMWANPTVRQKLLDSQRSALEAEHKAAEAKRAEEQKQAEAKRLEQKKLDAANALKAKGTTVATKSAIGSSKASALSSREELSRLYDELQGAA